MATVEKSRIRIALLRLTDAAPVVMGDTLGLFNHAGLEVEVSIVWPGGTTTSSTS